MSQKGPNWTDIEARLTSIIDTADALRQEVRSHFDMQQRHDALINESAKLLDETRKRAIEQASRPEKTEKAKAPAIPFEMLPYFEKVKTELRKITGTDAIYYSALKAQGFKHANEITDVNVARKIYKVLSDENKRLNIDKELRETLTRALGLLGRQFHDLLNEYHFESIDDVIKQSPKADISLFMEAVKSKVDRFNEDPKGMDSLPF